MVNFEFGDFHSCISFKLICFANPIMFAVYMQY